jgi:hypothetical protein
MGNPTVKRVLLADGLPPTAPYQPFPQVPRLRGEMPGQPKDLETPEAEE